MFRNAFLRIGAISLAMTGITVTLGCRPDPELKTPVPDTASSSPETTEAKAPTPSFKEGIPVDRPPHDSVDVNPVEAAIVAEWPVGSFIENVIALPDGSCLVSVISDHRIDRVDPDGQVEVFMKLDREPTGLSLVGDDLVVNVGSPGASGWALQAVSTTSRKARLVTEIPEALFLNGSTPFQSDSVLVTDSILGKIFRVNLQDSTHSVWLSDERLTKSTADPWMPGANGIAATPDAVWVASTERAMLMRIAVSPSGDAGDIEWVAERLVGDDMAISVDGTVYLTTHVYNQVLSIDPQGRRTEIAGADQFMNGATAATLNPDGDLMVTTTGGILAPVHGQVQTAKLVRLRVKTPAATRH